VPCPYPVKAKQVGTPYYGYRWYDPLTGRWLSRDPIGERGGVNVYGFVRNEGIAMTDYLGLAHYLTGNETAAENGAMLPIPEPINPVLPPPEDARIHDKKPWLLPEEQRPHELTPPTEADDFGRPPSCWVCQYKGNIVFEFEPGRLEEHFRNIYRNNPEGTDVEKLIRDISPGFRKLVEGDHTQGIEEMSATRGAACWKAKTEVLNALWGEYQKNVYNFAKLVRYQLPINCNCKEEDGPWDNLAEYAEHLD
jgi:RHS repeat-associated protein